MSETPRSPRRTPLPDVERVPWLYGPARSAARAAFRLTLNLRVSGREHVPATGAAIVAGNHRGLLDAPLVMAHVPRQATFLAKSELFEGRTAARALLALGQIPIDRGRPDRPALRRALGVLRDGELLGMFPEGTRGSGDFGSIQHGIGWLVLRSPGVPVVPVACLGTEAAMPKGARLPRRGARVEVVFGAPFLVPVEGDPRARRVVATAAELVRERLAAHLADAERSLT